jgi:hypothetical protein
MAPVDHAGSLPPSVFLCVCSILYQHVLVAGEEIGRLQPLLSVVPDKMSIGNHDRLVQVADHVLPMGDAESLREGILNATLKYAGSDESRHGLSQDFKAVYTFELTVTVAGLPFVADVVGLPLGAAIDYSLDPHCNSFLINSVVLDANHPAREPPWHDFAVGPHADQTLVSSYMTERESEKYGVETSRTVTVMYFDDLVDAGAEIEIYNDTPSSDEDMVSDVERSVKKACRSAGKGKKADLTCQHLQLDKALARATLSRVQPRRGRLVHFHGSYSHGVRRVRNSTSNAVRVSLVLEQFAFPKEVLKRVPTVKSMNQGAPFFASKEMKERFLQGNGTSVSYPGLSIKRTMWLSN